MNQIGIFWLDCNGFVLLAFKEPACKAFSQDNCFASRMSHAKFWLENRQFLSIDYNNRHYQSVPRGRVIYDKINKKIIVFLNKEFVGDTISQKAIKDEFQIKNCDFFYDAHYDLVYYDN